MIFIEHINTGSVYISVGKKGIGMVQIVATAGTKKWDNKWQTLDGL